MAALKTDFAKVLLYLCLENRLEQQQQKKKQAIARTSVPTNSITARIDQFNPSSDENSNCSVFLFSRNVSKGAGHLTSCYIKKQVGITVTHGSVEKHLRGDCELIWMGCFRGIFLCFCQRRRRPRMSLRTVWRLTPTPGRATATRENYVLTTRWYVPLVNTSACVIP